MKHLYKNLIPKSQIKRILFSSFSLLRRILFSSFLLSRWLTWAELSAKTYFWCIVFLYQQIFFRMLQYLDKKLTSKTPFWKIHFLSQSLSFNYDVSVKKTNSVSGIQQLLQVEVGTAWFRALPCRHTTLFQRLYNIHIVGTTSHER